MPMPAGMRLAQMQRAVLLTLINALQENALWTSIEPLATSSDAYKSISTIWNQLELNQKQAPGTRAMEIAKDVANIRNNP
eukprot:scaffold7487_cov1829-Prasinococcus_capsulatus_cf.AAC.1